MNTAERRFRGIALAAFSGLLTAVGHVAGGGSLGDLGLLVVLVPLLAGVFVSLAERSRGPLGTVAVLGGGQVALHYLMVVLHPPAMPVGRSMLLMHAVVTLVSAVGLRYADAAVEVAARALRRILPRRPAVLPADRPLRTLAVPGPGRVARPAQVLLGAYARRGPPVRC